MISKNTEAAGTFLTDVGAVRHDHLPFYEGKVMILAFQHLNALNKARIMKYHIWN